MCNITEQLEITADLAEKAVAERFSAIRNIERANQKKVLEAFMANRVSEAHFAGTAGYGYDDGGREVLDSVYKDVFKCQRALVRHQLATGTHALCVALFSVLRPGDTLLSITGCPYDTLKGIISGKGKGSLADFGINYKQVDLKDNAPDLQSIKQALEDKTVKLVLIQRSRGYDFRPSLSVDDIYKLCCLVKERGKLSLVDNCYGEFAEINEPSEFADLTVGSLIKNPGGGMALTGGYIAGGAELVEMAADRLIAPGLGLECGATLNLLRGMYQGFFQAPHVVAQALKSAAFAGQLMSMLGYQVLPLPNQQATDITIAIRFGQKDKLINFVRGIQAGSPIDGFVQPEPYKMPGYEDQVIMAAGGFVQGASIELSADAPIRPPYVCYLQGGLTYESARLGILAGVASI